MIIRQIYIGKYRYSPFCFFLDDIQSFLCQKIVFLASILVNVISLKLRIAFIIYSFTIYHYKLVSIYVVTFVIDCCRSFASYFC